MGRDFHYKIGNTREGLEYKDGEYGYDNYDDIRDISRHNDEICYDRIYSYDELVAVVLGLVQRGDSDDIWEAVSVLATVLKNMYSDGYVRIQYN